MQDVESITSIKVVLVSVAFLPKRISVPTIEVVIPSMTKQNVISVFTIKPIIPFTAHQDIVAEPPIGRSTTVTENQQIMAGAPHSHGLGARVMFTR